MSVSPFKVTLWSKEPYSCNVKKIFDLPGWVEPANIQWARIVFDLDPGLPPLSGCLPLTKEVRVNGRTLIASGDRCDVLTVYVPADALKKQGNTVEFGITFIDPFSCTFGWTLGTITGYIEGEATAAPAPSPTATPTTVRVTITAGSGGSVEYSIAGQTGTVAEGTYKPLDVPAGSSGTVTAKPKTGYKFKRWTYYIYRDGVGYGESYQNPYPFTANYRMSITAEFEQAAPEKVTVYIRVGLGLGKVCVDGTCTSSGYYQGVQFTKGATVTVNAQADAGYMLDYVLVDSKKYTSVPFSLSVQADTWITANFAPKPAEIRVQSFTASPYAGYAPLTVTFNASWSGGTPPYTVAVSYGDGYSDTKTTSSTSESFTHTYSKAGTFTATVRVRDSRGQEASSITEVEVRPPPQYLALTITGAEGGTIYYKGDSFRAGQYKIYQLQSGETVEITQKADSGYRFSYWRVDSKTNTSEVLRFTITTHTNVTAVFTKVTAPSPVVPSPVVPSPVVPSPVVPFVPSPVVPSPTVTPSPTPMWEQMMPMITMLGALLIGGAIVISLLRG